MNKLEGKIALIPRSPTKNLFTALMNLVSKEKLKCL